MSFDEFIQTKGFGFLSLLIIYIVCLKLMYEVGEEGKEEPKVEGELLLRRLGLEKKFSMMVSIAVTRMAVWSWLNVKLSVQKENCCRSGCFTRHLVSSMSDSWLARRTLCGGEYGTY